MSMSTQSQPASVDVSEGVRDRHAKNADLSEPARLLNRNFVLLWQGQAVSQLGGQIMSIAVVFWVKHATESATMIGVVMMMIAIPGALLGGVGGTIADSHSRRRIIIWCDLFRGILVLLLAGLLYALPDATGVLFVCLVMFAVSFSVTGSLFAPAIAASVPDLVPPDKVASAQSLRQITSRVCLFVGQGLGGTLFRLFGAPLLVLVNGLTFLFSAISECFVDIPQQIPERCPTWKEQLRSYKRRFAEGLQYVRKAPGLARVFVFLAILDFFTMPIFGLLPFYVEDYLRVRIDWYGYLLAINAAGVLVGSLAAGFGKLSGPNRRNLIIAFGIINSLLAVLFAFATGPFVAAGLAFVVGALGAFNVVNLGAIVQSFTPSEIRGRVLGLLATMTGSVAPLGMAVGGLVFDLVGQNVPLVYASCGAILAVLCLLMSTSSQFRQFLAFEFGTSR